MRGLSQNKKGMGIGDLYPIILTIAVVAILLGVVMFVMDEFTLMGHDTFSVTNESSAIGVGEAGITITNASICGFKDFAVTEVWNATNTSAAQDVNSSSYTYNAVTGSVFSTGHESNGSIWNISYTYSKWRNDDGCEAVEDISNDFVDFIPWIGIILLVVAAAIILGIVIQSFGKKQGV